jgi:hypothetical protein
MSLAATLWANTATIKKRNMPILMALLVSLWPLDPFSFPNMYSPLGKAVRYPVTPATGWKPLQHVIAVGLWMTFSTSNNLPMLRMTFRTPKRRMFSFGLIQQVICMLVTTSACFLCDILWIYDLKRFVRWMTHDALRLSHLPCVGLMAFHALRNMPMLRVVTCDAIQFRVLCHVCLHLTVRLSMACMTALFQAPVGVELHGSMRIVTSGTFFQFRSMGLSVTRATLGKDIFIGYFSGAIDMVGFVTLSTRYLMLATVFL